MSVDTTNAFNFNRYAYANNSPYRFTDPDGRKEKPLEGPRGSTRVEHVGPPDVKCNCHSHAWHGGQGDPTDEMNQDSNATPERWDQRIEDDIPNATKLESDTANKVGDIVVYGTDANEDGTLENRHHSALVIEVDSEGNTVRVQSKEGDGPLVDHHPSDQNKAYGDDKEWYRKNENK